MGPKPKGVALVLLVRKKRKTTWHVAHALDATNKDTCHKTVQRRMDPPSMGDQPPPKSKLAKPVMGPKT